MILFVIIKRGSAIIIILSRGKQYNQIIHQNHMYMHSLVYYNCIITVCVCLCVCVCVLSVMHDISLPFQLVRACMHACAHVYGVCVQ